MISHHPYRFRPSISVPPSQCGSNKKWFTHFDFKVHSTIESSHGGPALPLRSTGGGHFARDSKAFVRSDLSANPAVDYDPPMSVVLPALATAFAALCVWLAVRTVNRGYKPGKRFGLAIRLAVLVAYPLTFGPACWTCLRTGNGSEALHFFYRPIILVGSLPQEKRDHPGFPAKVILWYANLGVPDGVIIFMGDGEVWAHRMNGSASYNWKL
jgi:hypothetical protein